MDNLIVGKFSKKLYHAKDAVRILDPYQAALYWANGVEPLDIYSSRNHKTGKAVIVFVFKKDETKELFDLWCQCKLV